MKEIINPYATDGKKDSIPAATNIENERAIAEVKAMATIAKMNPRDPLAATDRILNECQRIGLAEVALYEYARGGQDITGPSIRLAEAMARNWGNIDFGVKELSQSDGKSEMMSYCWDLESNTRQVRIFTVTHKRFTKARGSYKLTDPRDIYENNSNFAARRLRAAVLAIIPGDVVDAAVAQCHETLMAKADVSPEGIKKMLEKFDKFGVKKDHIEKRIQRHIDAITPAQVVNLRKVYMSIKDGMSLPSDWFEFSSEDTTSQASKDLNAALNKQTDTPPEETVPGCVPDYIIGVEQLERFNELFTKPGKKSNAWHYAQGEIHGDDKNNARPKDEDISKWLAAYDDFMRNQ